MRSYEERRWSCITQCVGSEEKNLNGFKFLLFEPIEREVDVGEM